MAISYKHQIQPFVGEYNAEALSYEVTILFQVTGIADEYGYGGGGNMLEVLTDPPSGDYNEYDWTVANPTIPATVTLTHVGDYVGGGTYNYDVPCCLSSRRIANTTSEGTAELFCTYSGRVVGVHSVAMATQMIGEPLLQSLEKVGAIYPAIGSEGTTRDVSRQVITVTECLTNADWIAQAYNAARIAGSVNEDGWDPPWFPFGGGYPEGTFIYLGIIDQAADRRTQTNMITHGFARLSSLAEQHIFPWYEARLGANGKPEYSGTPTLAKIQWIAGTDDGFDGNTIPTFASLNLGLIRL